MLIPLLFAAGSRPLPVVIRSCLSLLFAAIVCCCCNHCCHSAVSAVYCCCPHPFSLLSLFDGTSHHFIIWSAVTAAVSCLWQTSSSSLIHHCCTTCHCCHPLSEAEPRHLHSPLIHHQLLPAAVITSACFPQSASARCSRPLLVLPPTLT